VYLAKPVVYLANCRVFEFFSLVNICVVYLAIFVVYLAKPYIFINQLFNLTSPPSVSVDFDTAHLAIFVVYLAKPKGAKNCSP